MIRIAANDEINAPWLQFAVPHHVHTIPPIPTDLVDMMSFTPDGFVLHIPLDYGYDIDWKESFSLNPVWVPWLDKWLRALPIHAGEEVEEGLKEVTSEELASRIAGWNARNIIDTFNSRWSTNNPEDPSSMVIAAERAIKRLETITRELLEYFSPWDSEDLGPKALLLQKLTRPWRYQELCLLQAELKARYSLTRIEAVSRYRSCAHAWQSCWKYDRIRDYAFQLQYPMTISTNPGESEYDSEDEMSETEDLDCIQ